MLYTPVGDVFALRTLDVTSGRTQPPGPLTESELITDMDKNGIGTDATSKQLSISVSCPASVKSSTIADD